MQMVAQTTATIMDLLKEWVMYPLQSVVVVVRVNY
jgi:hypothetical protein